MCCGCVLWLCAVAVCCGCVMWLCDVAVCCGPCLCVCMCVCICYSVFCNTRANTGTFSIGNFLVFCFGVRAHIMYAQCPDCKVGFLQDTAEPGVRSNTPYLPLAFTCALMCCPPASAATCPLICYIPSLADCRVLNLLFGWCVRATVCVCGGGGCMHAWVSGLSSVFVP